MRWTIETLDALYKVCCPLRCIALGLFLIHATAGVAAERPPNIVFILADDLGWSDTTPYGSTFYETPNIDKLASQGRRFTDAHSASAVCTPSRYTWLTGRYAGASTSNLYRDACGGPDRQGFPGFNTLPGRNH